MIFVDPTHSSRQPAPTYSTRRVQASTGWPDSTRPTSQGRDLMSEMFTPSGQSTPNRPCTRRVVALSPRSQRASMDVARRVQRMVVEQVSTRPTSQGREFTSGGVHTRHVGPIQRPLAVALNAHEFQVRVTNPKR